MVVKETKRLYKSYLNSTNSRWEYGNSVLYRMCEEEPEHKEIDVIVGKIWLIGRSYAAAIERRKNAVVELQEYLDEQLGVYELPRKLDGFLLTAIK